MKFLSDLKLKDLKGKVCLLRIDLNILDKDISVNNLRVQAVLPTMQYLIKNGAKVVLLSHRGRPVTKISNFQFPISNEFSLRKFKNIYEKLLKQSVRFVNSTDTLKYISDFSKVSDEIRNSKNNIFLLENLRFFEGEEKNDLKFAKGLADLGDVYINDAFAVSHRANASVAAITKYLPSYAGLLLENELNNLGKVRGITQSNQRGMTQKRNGFVFVLGGAKISDKIGVLENFANKADYFLTGGGIAINLFMAQGLPIGDSICELDKIEFSKKVLKKYSKKIVLPADVVIDKRKILDIGPETIKIYSDIIRKAKTVVWNGPMGQIEIKKFMKGSDEIVRAVLNSKAFTVVGGGETATLFSLKAKSSKLKANLFISTGGGAMLEYLSGKVLPGIEALKNTKTLKH